MGNLSQIQENLFEQMVPRVWYCAAELECRVSTLRAMAKKGTLDTKVQPSALAVAETALLFKRRR